ncbi:MAG: hypothetical protein ACQ9MH_16555 [Nitrospinales bacterium]
MKLMVGSENRFDEGLSGKTDFNAEQKTSEAISWDLMITEQIDELGNTSNVTVA